MSVFTGDIIEDKNSIGICSKKYMGGIPPIYIAPVTNTTIKIGRNTKKNNINHSFWAIRGENLRILAIGKRVNYYIIGDIKEQIEYKI